MDKKVKKFLSSLLLVFLGLGLSGCAFEPTYRGQKIHPAYPEMVEQCAFVGEVTGESHFSYTPFGRQFAKYRAMDEAGRIGATHIVWEAMTSGVHPTAYGRAYRCPCKK